MLKCVHSVSIFTIPLRSMCIGVDLNIKTTFRKKRFFRKLKLPTGNQFLRKELSFCHNLKFSNFYISATSGYKP